MGEKDITRIETIKDSLCAFIVKAANCENKTTSTCEAQVLAEVVTAFCKVVSLTSENIIRE